MEFYIFIISALILFAFFDLINLKQDQKLFFLIIIFILFVFHDGFRWETGADWYAYRDFFEETALGQWRPAFEVGYRYFSDFVYFFSQNYSVFLIVHAVVIYTLYLKSIHDYTEYPLITALCFYFLFFGYMGMNRQHIAIAICLFAVRYIISREFIKFFLLVILAVTFHFSAMIFLIAYFVNRKIKTPYYIWAILFAIVLNPILYAYWKWTKTIPVHLLTAYKDSFGPFAKLVYYFLESGGPPNKIINITVGLMKRFFIFTVVYLNIDKIKEKVPNVRLILNLYFLSILIYIVFTNNFQIFIGRGGLYYGNVFEAFLLPCLILLFKKKDNRLLMYFTVIFMIAFLNSSIRPITEHLFNPYKGIFINTDYFRIMYKPDDE